jgi:hypothetical protein
LLLKVARVLLDVELQLVVHLALEVRSMECCANRRAHV